MRLFKPGDHFFTERLEQQPSPHPLTLQWLIEQQEPKEPSLQCPCSSPPPCSSTRQIENLSSRMDLQSTATQHLDRLQDGSLSAAPCSLPVEAKDSKKITWPAVLKSLLCGVQGKSRLLFANSFLVFLLHFFSVNRMIQMQSEQHFLHWFNGKNTFQPAENYRGPISVQISVYEWIEESVPVSSRIYKLCW